MQKYTHLTEQERYPIYLMTKADFSLRYIATSKPIGLLVAGTSPKIRRLN